MPSTIVLGNLSADAHAAEELELPFLDGVAAGPAITEALDLAAAQRRGVAVLGPKGIGKSDALVAAIEAWDEAEDAKQELDASYRRRRILLVRAPRSPSAPGGASRSTKANARLLSYRAVLLTILGALLGVEPDDRVRSRRKTDQELLTDVVEAARVQDVAVLAIEEAERLAPDGFTALRDVMADAEATAPGRRVASGASGERALRAGGVGVVLVGTPDVRPTLEASGEAGERWAAVVTITGLRPADVPDVLLCFFPTFATAERAMDARGGRGAWRAKVIELVAAQQPWVSLRHLENVARSYFRLVVRNTPPEYPIPTRETAPFHPEILEFVARAATWHRPTYADGMHPRAALDDALGEQGQPRIRIERRAGVAGPVTAPASLGESRAAG